MYLERILKLSNHSFIIPLDISFTFISPKLGAISFSYCLIISVVVLRLLRFSWFLYLANASLIVGDLAISFFAKGS